MFKKKQTVLSNILPHKEANALIGKFREEVVAAAKKYGIDCYSVLVEFPALTDKGERSTWLTAVQNGTVLQLAGLIAWAYGRNRGNIEVQIDAMKQHGFSERGA